MFRFPCSGIFAFHNRGPFQSTIASEQRHFLCSPTIFFQSPPPESATAP